MAAGLTESGKRKGHSGTSPAPQLESVLSEVDVSTPSETDYLGSAPRGI